MEKVYIAQLVESFDSIDEFESWLNRVASRGYRIATTLPGDSSRADVFGPIIILEQLELFATPDVSASGEQANT